LSAALDLIGSHDILRTRRRREKQEFHRWFQASAFAQSISFRTNPSALHPHLAIDRGIAGW
jgi:hypothetical protein